MKILFIYYITFINVFTIGIFLNYKFIKYNILLN